MATIETLKNSPLFKDLSHDELARLLANMGELVFEPDEIILTQNTPAQAVYVLKSGTVKVMVDGEIVDQVDTPQCFGEMSCVSPDMPASATVITQGRCVMLSIGRDDFLKALEDVPQFWRSLFVQSSARLKRLAKRQSEILEHSPQGFMKLDRAARVTHEYSAKCTRYFSMANLAGQSFPALLYPQQADQRASWLETYEWLFHDSLMDFEDLANLLTREVTLHTEWGEHDFVLTYHPSRDMDGQLVAVDVGVEDVTEQRKLERINAALTEQKDILGKIYQHPEAFFESVGLLGKTLSELSELAQAWMTEPATGRASHLDEVMRNLHSLKGFAGMYSLRHIQSRAHGLETILRELAQQSAPDQTQRHNLEEEIDALHQESLELERLVERMGNPLRQRLMGTVVSEHELTRLREAIDQGDLPGAGLIMRQIESLDAATLFMGWSVEVQKLCILLNKQARFEPVTQSARIPKASFLALSQVLPHLLFNAMSHGIEHPEVREFAGKSAVGTVSVQLRQQGELLDIEVRDDGQGLDFNTLPEIARSKPLLDQAEVARCTQAGEAWRILLMPGFSTAQEITTVSGRGVGLDAVQARVVSLGGRVQIESTPGQGMVFHLYIPLQQIRSGHVSQ